MPFLTIPHSAGHLLTACRYGTQRQRVCLSNLFSVFDGMTIWMLASNFASLKTLLARLAYKGSVLTSHFSQVHVSQVVL
jgi:hypothetical protein